MAKVLASIEITTPPTKTAYFSGETFNPAGMVVTAHYTDGSSQAVSGYTYSPAGALATGNTTITVSYSEGGVTKTDTQAITVTTISNTLNSNSWATIKAVSDAGQGDNYWDVGDTKASPSTARWETRTFPTCQSMSILSGSTTIPPGRGPTGSTSRSERSAAPRWAYAIANMVATPPLRARLQHEHQQHQQRRVEQQPHEKDRAGFRRLPHQPEGKHPAGGPAGGPAGRYETDHQVFRTTPAAGTTRPVM